MNCHFLVIQLFLVRPVVRRNSHTLYKVTLLLVKRNGPMKW